MNDRETMDDNVIPRMGLARDERDVASLSDADLLREISEADLDAACDDEDQARGWGPADSGRVARAESEYRRRFGAPCPANRSASWALHHAPPTRR